MTTEAKPTGCMGRMPGGTFGESIYCEIQAETHDGDYVVQYRVPTYPGPMVRERVSKSRVTPDNPESLRETLDNERLSYLMKQSGLPPDLRVLLNNLRDDAVRERLRGLHHLIGLALEDK